jgi:hypothetical protein
MPKKTEKQEALVITTVRIPRGFWGKVRIRAYEEGLGTGELIIKALDQYMKGEK